MEIVDLDQFAYRPECSERGCGAVAVYKLAAPWTDGTSRELKNYGLACERHAPALLEAARRRSEGLLLAEGESIGRVALYRLVAGRRDAGLIGIDEGEGPPPT